MRVPLLATTLLVSLAGCRVEARDPTTPPRLAEQRAIADTLMTLLADAYDFARPGVPQRLIALYPDTGRVVSAASGRVTTSRTALASEINTFWENVGKNMRDAHWEWDSVYVNVLSRDAAVLTATYRIPHLTPQGEPHTIAGAWTAVFERRPKGWVIIQEHLSDVPELTASTMVESDSSRQAEGDSHAH